MPQFSKLFYGGSNPSRDTMKYLNKESELLDAYKDLKYYEFNMNNTQKLGMKKCYKSEVNRLKMKINKLKFKLF